MGIHFPRLRRRHLAPMGLTALASLWVLPAQAIGFVCTTGNWEAAACWSPAGVPTATDTASITAVGGVATTVNFGASAGARSVNVLTLDTPGSANVQLLQTGGDLGIGSLRVGPTGHASVVLSGGASHVGTLLLGNSLQSAGHFLQSAGQLDTDTLKIGSAGDGDFTQNGGTHRNRVMAIGGAGLGGAATRYDLNGGLLLSTQQVTVGNQYGPGFFRQTGGSFAAEVLDVGGQGYGDFTAMGSALIDAVQVRIGVTPGGEGTFSQFDAGTSVTAQTLLIGPGENGRYLLGGGVLNTTRTQVQASVVIGFEQTGGTHRTGQLSVAGTAAGKRATYWLDGGLLTATATTVGSDAAGGGDFTHSAGEHRVAGTLTVAATGRYVLGGSGLLQAGMVFNQGSFEHAAGRFVGTLVNAGSFTYGLAGAVGPQFDGQLINLGAVVLNADATFGDGLRNESVFATLAAGRSLTLDGQGLQNIGRFTMSGGALQGSGPLRNEGSMSGWGRIAGTGALLNNGSVVQEGGNLVLANARANVNEGDWALQASRQLQLEGTTTWLLNQGQFSLNGGSVTGTGTFWNTGSGVISGSGAVSSQFRNGGSLALGAADHVTLPTAASNTGLVTLGAASALLSGGALVNTGMIVGQGRVVNVVNNTGGRIRAEGGVLALAGAVSSNGVLEAGAGATLSVQRTFAANTGTLQLDGGSIDFGSQHVGNRGNVSGYGTLRAGSIENVGRFQLTSGQTQVFGTVQNLKFGQIIVSGAGTATFYDAVQADSGSEIRVSVDGRAVFFSHVTQYGGADFNGQGTYYFEGGYSTGGTPALTGAEGNVVLGAANVFDTAIGGTDAGSGYGHFGAGGSLSFGGTLKVAVSGGFELQAGQHFDLFDWGVANGQFAAVDLSAAPLADGLRWDTSQLYTDGSIAVTAVPEPATWALWLAGLGAGGWLRRRRAGTPGRGLVLAAGAVVCAGAGAAPIAPDAMQQIGVYAPGTECADTTEGAWIPCATTTNSALALAVTGHWGAQVIASATVGVDQLQAHLQGITRHGWDVGMPVMDVVQFDQITVTGPTDMVQIAVHAHIVGSGAPSNSDYANGTWTFAMGARNPAPAADYIHYGDWLALPGRVLFINQQMWSTSSGAVHPLVDMNLSSTMTVATGQAFELGSELTITVLNLDVSFSQVQWSFDLPAGYQLTSTRGLSVGAVPEPGSAAMWLAGLAGLGFVVARRQGAVARLQRVA